MSDQPGAASPVLLLIGAGHTHIEILRQSRELIRAGVRVICVSPEPEHPYSGMGPGLLGGTYQPEELLLPAARIARSSGGEFREDLLVGLDPDAGIARFASGHEIAYSALSLNIGSESVHGDEFQLPHVYTAKPVRRLLAARRTIEERAAARQGLRIAVLGGGPAGVELAGNAACLLARLRAAGSITLYSARIGELAGVRGRRFRYIARQLGKAGVEVIAGARRDARDLDADIVLAAGGVRPSRVLTQLKLPLAPDGSLPVDRFLRVQGYRNIFAVGDCAWVRHPGSGKPLDRVGVYAVRQQAVLLHNLRVAAGEAQGPAGAAQDPAGDTRGPAAGSSAGGDLQEFRGVGPYLAGVNLGCGVGLLYKGWFTLYGKTAFRVKDWLDRRFMRRYV